MSIAIANPKPADCPNVKKRKHFPLEAVKRPKRTNTELFPAKEYDFYLENFYIANNSFNAELFCRKATY